MDGKKITFGFSKTIKKPQLLLNNKTDLNKNKVELITCLEGKAIKLVNEKEEEKPLIIPLQNSSKTSRALESLKIRKAVLDGANIENNEVKERINTSDIFNDSKLDSLERRAITELLVEARTDFNSNGAEQTNSKLTIVVKPEDLPLDGANESTTDDYESVPIEQFGMAMLRGMGLKEEIKKKKAIDDDILIPRPKGMGLGADKTVKRQPALIPPEENEKLEIKKNACVKILAGKCKSQYGIIEGFDDRTGRAVIKLALGGSKESLGEYLIQPVSKREYQTYGKVINSEKYDEYKRKQNEIGTSIFVKNEIIKKEPGIKSENFQNYDKYNTNNSNLMQNSKYSSDDEQEYKPDLRIKIEKTDDNKSNSRNNNIEKDNSKNEESTSRRYSSEKEEYSKSYNRNMSSRNYHDRKNDSYRSSKYHNDDNNYCDTKEKTSNRRSRSTEYRRNEKNYSDTDSSESSPERQRHKSSKKSKSKKSKKSRHKYNNSSSEDEKKHKKKTKKSRKSRSRSRHRR